MEPTTNTLARAAAQAAAVLFACASTVAALMIPVITSLQ